MHQKKTLKNATGKQSLYDYMVKLIIIGDSGVGKTNILIRFCDNIFKQSHVATIGVDFSVRTVQIEDKRIRLQIWDTAGQERFKTITETYYKGATGILLVYGVDSRESFTSVEKWVNQVLGRTATSVKKILIANKVDVEPEFRAVSRAEGELMAEKYGLTYVEVSAKTNQNIDQSFFILAKMIKSQLDQQNSSNKYGQVDGLSRSITLNTNIYRKGKQYAKNGQNIDQSKNKCAC